MLTKGHGMSLKLQVKSVVHVDVDVDSERLQNFKALQMTLEGS